MFHGGGRKRATAERKIGIRLRIRNFDRSTRQDSNASFSLSPSNPRKIDNMGGVTVKDVEVCDHNIRQLRAGTAS